MDPVFLADKNPELFPDPKKYDDNGLVALSRSLGTSRLIAAYRQGIFPWLKMAQAPNLWCWYSPNPRMLLYPEDFKIPRSLAQSIKRKDFDIRVDYNFAGIMRACASIKRPNQESTWIEPEMETDYGLLHQQGIAHSIEAYCKNELVGGLYGLAIGRAFFGESMFHKRPEASKTCIHYLTEIARNQGVRFIDCQVPNPFLRSLGAREVSRGLFLSQLKEANPYKKSTINWNDLAKNIP